MVPYNIDGEGDRGLIVTYTLGSGNGQRPAMLQLTGVNVGDGQWHNISVVRERSMVTLSVDSDEDGYSVTSELYIHCLLIFNLMLCHIVSRMYGCLYFSPYLQI